jgi:hypothetical protein
MGLEVGSDAKEVSPVLRFDMSASCPERRKGPAETDMTRNAVKMQAF